MSKLRYKEGGVWKSIAPSQKEFDDNKAEVTAQLAEKAKQTDLNATNAEVTLKATKVELSNVLNGTPKGTYATIAALQAAYPTGTTGVYIVTADGHIYSWSGSAWTDRGLYQAVGIADSAITTKQTNFANTIPTSVNLFDKTKATVGGYYTNTGVWTVDATYATSDYIPVEEGQTYIDSYGGSVVYFTENKLFVSGAYLKKFTVPTGQSIKYARTNTLVANLSTEMVVKAQTLPTVYVPYTSAVKIVNLKLDKTNLDFLTPDVTEVSASINLFDKTKVTAGGYFDATGAWVIDAIYAMSDFIPVIEGQTYIHGFGGSVVYYTAAKTFVSGLYASKFTVTVGTSIAFVRTSSQSANIDTEMFVVGDKYPSTYVPYTKGAVINGLKINHPLYGLKWNVLGDSLTFGLTATKPYPYLIGIKTGMIVRNYGISGSYISNGLDPMSVRYTSMNNDADIITVFGGTNDRGGHKPLGVWGDTTNETLYGAMKILVEGLLTKYPKKRIGFILPTPIANDEPAFPMESYANVVKDVCSRYSIPTLDLLHGSGLAPNHPASKAVYFSDDVHMNDEGHVLISRKIEAFLLSL